MTPTSLAYLFVDAHNLIHAWEEFREIHQNPSQRHLAREALLQILRTYHDAGNARVIVVFDGTQATVREERDPGGMQIFYGSAKISADTIIERLALKYGEKYTLRVVTGDRAQRDSILASGAFWIPPDEFRAQLVKHQNQHFQQIHQIKKQSETFNQPFSRVLDQFDPHSKPEKSPKKGKK